MRLPMLPVDPRLWDEVLSWKGEPTTFALIHEVRRCASELAVMLASAAGTRLSPGSQQIVEAVGLTYGADSVEPLAIGLGFLRTPFAVLVRTEERVLLVGRHVPQEDLASALRQRLGDLHRSRERTLA